MRTSGTKAHAWLLKEKKDRDQKIIKVMVMVRKKRYPREYPDTGFDDLIQSYISGEPLVITPPLDTKTYRIKDYNPEKFEMLKSSLQTLKSLKKSQYPVQNAEQYGLYFTVDAGLGKNLKYNERYKYMSWLNKRIEAMKGYRTSTFQSGHGYADPNASAAQGNFSNDYISGSGIADPPELQKDFSYPTMDFKDYDVYMSYYRSMGFYIPNRWIIDMDRTRIFWRDSPKGFAWRKLVILYVGGEQYQEFHHIPLVGGILNAADYWIGEFRSWFMLPTLAFSKTVSRTLMSKMEKALSELPFNQNEHFQHLGGIYSEEVPPAFAAGVGQIGEQFAEGFQEGVENVQNWWEDLVDPSDEMDKERGYY